MFRNLGIHANIVCLPGHTSDSISIIFDDGNALIGDAAMNTLSILGLHNRPLVAENSSLIPKSWEKIKDLGGITLHVSHGKSFNINKLKFKY